MHGVLRLPPTSASSSAPAAQRRYWRRAAVLLGLLAATVGLSACGSDVDHRMLVADAGSGGSGGLRLYAVKPGEKVTPKDVVATGLTGGDTINTVESDSLVRRDQVGTAWAGRALIAGNDGSGSRVTAAVPGQLPTVLNSAGQALTSIVERGVLVETAKGCSLATPDGPAKVIGTGRCSISEDERWVASWPFQGGALSIRDLRSDKVRRVAGLDVSGNASALGRDAVVLAPVQAGGGTRLALVSATSGKVVARTSTVRQVGRIDPKSEGTPGFAVSVQTDSGTELWFVGTDGKVTVVDRAPAVLVLSTRGAITYLKVGEGGNDGKVLRRSDNGSVAVLGGRPGNGTSDELVGVVGGGQVGEKHLLLTRETAKGIEFWLAGNTGDFAERVVTVPSDQAGGAVVDEMLTIGDVAWLAVTTGQTQSLVRIHLSAGEGEAVLENQPFVAINSVDVDGTVLVSAQARGNADQPVVMATFGTSGTEATVRLRLSQPIAALLHDGAIYLGSSQDEQPVVRWVAPREQGATVLYEKYQLAGSLWPNNNGATSSKIITPGLLAQQAQQQAQQQGAAAGGAGPAGG